MSTDHALDAELWVTGNVAGLRAHTPTDEMFESAVSDLIDEAGRDGRPQSLVLLKVLAAVGPQGHMEPAGRAADHLAARLQLQDGRLSGPGGAVEQAGQEQAERAGQEQAERAGQEQAGQDAALPHWVDLLGKATVGDCFVWSDVFGGYDQLYCVFTHADRGRRHGLVCTIDLTFRGVIVRIGVTTTDKEVDEAITLMEKDARRKDGQFKAITAEDARRRLAAALDAFEAPTLPSLATGPKFDEEFYGALPLVAQRVSGMPGGVPDSAVGQSVAEVWTAQRRQALADEFIEARPDGWVDRECARMLAARIVDASVDVFGFPPDRIGPTVVGRLFGEVLPTTLGVPDVALREAERVAQQWIEWRAESQNLPKKARRRLQEITRTALKTFSRVSRDRKANPHFPYLADLPLQQARGGEIQKVMNRRAFAVPFPGHRGSFGVELATPMGDLPAGETHVDDLDAGNPAHRALIVIADRPTHGTDQTRIEAQRGVVEQLWDDEPAEVWQAAQRLTATGMSRQSVLQRLATVWQRHAPDSPESLTSGLGADPDSLDAYAAALRSLGPDPGRRR